MASIYRKIRRRLLYTGLAVTRNIEGRAGIASRAFLYRKLCVSFGSNVRIGPAVFINEAEKLALGSNVSINEFCLISCSGGLDIGSDVSIAHNCSILTTSHLYQDPDVPIRDSGVKYDAVSIADNVWFGCGVRILCGSNVESGVVVAANSVARGRLESNSIYAGTPAKRIKSRLEKP